jgi:hypothetical protein
MTTKRKPVSKTPSLKGRALDNKLSAAVKGGFLGGLIKRAGKAVSR